MKDEEYLRREAEGKRKCEKIMEDKFGKKNYISNNKIVEVRNIFKTRVGMINLAGNFSNDKRFMRTNWMCRCENEKESEEHVTKECRIYEDIRHDYEDLCNDAQLASFFAKVLERRDLVDTLEEDELETESTNLAARAADVIARPDILSSRADLLV